MPDEITFYRANGKNGYLSNLYPAPMEFRCRDGIRAFADAERAYQFQKFTDIKAAEWAVAAPSAHLVAIVGHGLFPFDVVPGWNDRKTIVMQEVVLAKFMQHPELARKLKHTGVATIPELCDDHFWGSGKNGKGQNRLGYILLYVRERIKHVQ